MEFDLNILEYQFKSVRLQIPNEINHEYNYDFIIKILLLFVPQYLVVILKL